MGQWFHHAENHGRKYWSIPYSESFYNDKWIAGKGVFISIIYVVTFISQFGTKLTPDLSKRNTSYRKIKQTTIHIQETRLNYG